jgi:hypothetical protein
MTYKELGAIKRRRLFRDPRVAKSLFDTARLGD